MKKKQKQQMKKTIMLMIYISHMVRKPISKEQLLVSWSFIAFNRGKVDGWNEKDPSAS